MLISLELISLLQEPVVEEVNIADIAHRFSPFSLLGANSKIPPISVPLLIMPVKVVPLPLESLDTFASIACTAFTRGIGRLCIGPPNPLNLAFTALRQRKHALEDPRVRFFQAVDDETGEVLGVAKWVCFEEGSTMEQVEKACTVPQEGCDDELLAKAILSTTSKPLRPQDARSRARAVSAQVNMMDENYVASYHPSQQPVFDYYLSGRRDLMGTRPFLFLVILAVHPKHQRKGVGAALLRWGTERADALGIDCFLEATPEGYRSYERAGFRIGRERTFDMRPFGEQGDDWSGLLVRESRRSATGFSRNGGAL